MFNWNSKPNPKEEQRKIDKQLRKTGRDLERDKRELEREEKKIELEIKRLAAAGNKEGCAILAKQLVQLRKQKTRVYAMNSKIQGVGIQSKNMQANVKLANTMGLASKTMSDMNNILNPAQISANANAFSKESMKMEMTEEMINDTFDDILNESDDEEQSDAIINQVLDEIGIEISGKIAEAPSPSKGKIGESSKGKTTDEDIIAKLANLKN